MKKLFYTLAIIIGICIIVVPLLFIFVLNHGGAAYTNRWQHLFQ